MGNELSGKVAVVTGGSSGIGLGITTRFLDEGARVVIADVNDEAGEAIAKELGDGAAFRRTDVSDTDDVARLVEYTVDTFGGIDVMFNNAGISGARHKSLLDEDFADFHQVLGVNLLGVMSGTREAARHMSANGGGSIINVSSIGGIEAAPGQWAYHVSKSSVIFFTRCAAVDLGQHAIRVNCIAPGNIETPILERTMTSHLPEEERGEVMQRIRSYLVARQAIHRQGTTDDIAEAALYLASDRSTYVTGTLLPVDGGMVAGTQAQSADFGARPAQSQ